MSSTHHNACHCSRCINAFLDGGGVVTDHCCHCRRSTEHCPLETDQDGVMIWECAICDGGKIPSQRKIESLTIQKEG